MIKYFHLPSTFVTQVINLAMLHEMFNFLYTYNYKNRILKRIIH